MIDCQTVFIRFLLVSILIGGYEFSLAQEKNLLELKTHVVQRDETIQDILKQYAITYKELIHYNPRLSRRRLRKKMNLKIPLLERQELSENQSNDAPFIVKKDTISNLLDHLSLVDSNQQILNINQITDTYDIDFSELLYLYPDIRRGENNFVMDSNKIQSYKNLFEYSPIKSKIYSRADLDQLISKSLSPKNLHKLNPIINDTNILNQIFSIIDYQQNKNTLDTITEVEQIEKEINYLKALNQMSLEKIDQYGLRQTKLEELFLSGIDITLPKIDLQRLSVHEKIKSQFLSDIDLNFERTRKSLRIALLLPIGANHFIELNHHRKIQGLNRIRNLTTISIDFLLGCELAIQTAKEFGANVELTVLDTQNNQNTINQILDIRNISSYHAIVGPLIAENFNYLSSNTDLVAIDKYFPISTNPIIRRPNVYQTQTSNDIIQQKMLQYIQSTVNNQNHNVLIVTDDYNQDYANKLKTILPASRLVIPTETNYLSIESVIRRMDPNKLNTVILASDSSILYSNAISLFSSIDKEENNFEIQLINTSVINAFSMIDLLSQEYNNLDITFPSLNRANWGGYPSVFENIYYSMFGKPPSLESIRGYDLILDIINQYYLKQDRISSENQLKSRVYNNFGFDYRKNESGGFYNTLFFLLRYHNGKLLELVGEYKDSIW